MPTDHHVLRVYETGPLTVVGFGGAEVLDQIDLVECREEILELLQLHECKTLAFDLTGVRYVPSGMLGLLASLVCTVLALLIPRPKPPVDEHPALPDGVL